MGSEIKSDFIMQCQRLVSMVDDKSLRKVSNKIFDKFDTDGSGTLSPSELKAFLEQVTLKLKIKVPESAVEKVVKQFDTDKSRELDKDEFFKVVKSLVAQGGGKSKVSKPEKMLGKL